ncbi:PKD domain-containing protein [Pontiellaceae bacterium B1224]|nr:PKD domain-containing protein [Pontiellaceae bacterium B1224]
MKKSILVGVAVFAAGAASAAVVEFPNLSNGGDFTLDAGDVTYTTNGTAAVPIADNAVATLNINGDWIAGDANEVQLGGVSGKDDPLQDVQLNIGSDGSFTFGKMWVGGVWAADANTGLVAIDMAEGAQLIISGGSWGIRVNGTTWTRDGINNTTGGAANSLTLYQMLWNEGALTKDGVQVGTFDDNFEFTGALDGASVLTAISPPDTAALITPSVTTGFDPLEVIFDGTESRAAGTITDYNWVFGDGNTGSGVLASNTYTVAGNYTAWLTIMDDLGNTASNSVVITVDPAVVANITTTQDSNYAPLGVIFDGTTSTSVYGAVTSYSWTFGDGNSATGPFATNTYTVVGDYTAWLTIEDDQGNLGSNSVDITVASIDYGIQIDDDFDDGNIGENTLGIGTGFVSGTQTGGIIVETNGTVTLDSPMNGARRTRISSRETADTVTEYGASYVFEGVNFAFSADDSGDGSSSRTYIGIRDNAGAGDEGDNPEEGFYLEFGFGQLSGNPAGTSTFFYNSAANVKTTLANWTFDNLLLTDAEVSSNVVLDIEMVVTASGWSLDILGDTYGGGSAISFSGTHAASSITNTVDTGHVFALNQCESPNLAMSIDRVVVEQIQGVPLVVPNITSVSSDGSTVSLSWDSEPGFDYNVLSRTDLAFGGWSTNIAAVPGAGTTTTTNVTPSGGMAEFFQIEAY